MEHRVSFLILIAFLLTIVGCEESPCLKGAGDEVEYEEIFAPFNIIEIHDDFEVQIIPSEDTLVRVITHENIEPHLQLEVVDRRLVMRNNNTCNFLREYNPPQVQIYHPNLRSINNLGYNKVFSTDTLPYTNLILFSKASTGDYDLLVNCETLSVNINRVNNLTLAGRTALFSFGIYAGDGRIDARHLIAEEVNFYHRGSNDALVYPVHVLRGEIAARGNVIYYNEPEEMDVFDPKFPGVVKSGN